MTKKITPLKKNILFLFFLFAIPFCFAQSGKVTGTLTGKDGFPLPGVSVILKGQNTGTVTDFDGYYSIECTVGDTLEFIYLGFKPREVRVTEKMFDKNKKTNSLSLRENKTINAREEPVAKITSEAYIKAFHKGKQKLDYVKIKENASHKRKDDSHYLNLNRLKKIDIDSNEVKLKYYDSNLFFDAEFNQKTTFRFVSKRNLHNLQTTFSQGRPIAGNLMALGPETGEIFSFGPRINSTTNQKKNLFKNTYNTHTNINLNITSSRSKFKLSYSNDNKESIFGFGENKKNQYNLNYTYKYKEVKLENFFRYVNKRNTQPNSNGLNTNIIRSHFSTPPSFDNSKGSVFNSGSQRSFSPSEYNNPNWLLNNNQNNNTNDSFLGGIKTKFNLGRDLKLTPSLSYTSNKVNSKFNLPLNTVGFFDGYLSSKKINQTTFDTGVKLDLNLGSNFKYYFNTDFEHLNINYRFNETNRLIENSLFNASRSQKKHRNSFRFSNKFSYEFYGGDLDGFASITNHSLNSSTQGNKLFQPAISARINFENLFYSYFLTRLALASTASIGVSESPLLYSNSSHSSLILNPIDSYSYTANDELFIDKNLSFEEVENYHFTLFASFWHLLDLEFTQYHKTSKNSIFPIITNTNFKLSNIADIKTIGYEAKVNFKVRPSRRFGYYLDINLSTYKNEVTKIHSGVDYIPVAGFKGISKNLAQGQPAGVIIGSAYERDENNAIIIGDDGYPLVADTPKVIGDPNPDFNVGITNRFNFGDFNFDFTIDIQKGGDVWNGTQQAINYLGVSEETAQLRHVENFVFNGVTTSGESNTTGVNFVDLNTDITTNRWSRYGYTGIDEEAIVDGSYIHLKSIQVSYDIIKDDYSYSSQKKLLKKFELGIYANDIFTVSKYDGAAPYSNLLDTDSGNGLHFFNTPTISEIGLRAKIKF